TIYAIPDREFDRQLGINSSALFFGPRAPQAVGLFYIGTVIMLLWLGLTMSLGPLYWFALSAAAFLWDRQYRQLARIPKSPQIFGNMFRQNVTIGFILLAGMALSVL
ncbi:MAG: UbiA family prenyltransferase, partial [Cyanobacteria bacterium P01_D01_bin.1]